MLEKIDNKVLRSLIIERVVKRGHDYMAWLIDNYHSLMEEMENNGEEITPDSFEQYAFDEYSYELESSKYE